jgi:hypothetical protein
MTRSDKGTPQGGVIQKVFYAGNGPAVWAKAYLVRYRAARVTRVVGDPGGPLGPLKR